jgi:hypothetical protein
LAHSSALQAKPGKADDMSAEHQAIDIGIRGARLIDGTGAPAATAAG